MKAITLTSLLLPTATAQVTSQLWGSNGELWDPVNGVLKDFTDVGYMNGNEPIPTWPVGVNVLDFGAIPNDEEDDSQAFINAIAACPPETAVFVPKGKYIILQQIRVNRDYVVLRGEDMYETVLFFPKNLGEIYPAARYDESYGYKGGFWYVDGGTHKSIENLTFEFRNQMKGGFWEFRGANSIKYIGGVVNSWIRNIHFRNADTGVEFLWGEQISVLNLYFDHYYGRQSFITSADHEQQVGYLGLGFGRAYKSLFHNVEFTGNMFHELDIINVPSYNVLSKIEGPSVDIQHHGRGAHHNLYTEIYCGAGGSRGLEDGRSIHHETHWGIHADDGDLYQDPYTTADQNYNVFVGYDEVHPTTITDTMYYEAIDPAELSPSNIYVAQMLNRGKFLPQGPPVERPLFTPDQTGNVRWLIPVDDVKRDGSNPFGLSIPFDGFLKFNLRYMDDLSGIEHVRLRICTSHRTTTSFTLKVSEVHNDAWTQDSIDAAAVLQSVGILLGSTYVDNDFVQEWYEFDVTEFVQAQWETDQVVSFYVGNDRADSFLGGFHTRESGNAPQLIIEQVASPVPGPPSAPTGMYTISDDGHILLDWDDNTEADFAYYNVYRSLNEPSLERGHPIGEGLTMSEFADISIKEDRGLCEIPSNTLCFYTVTAVDTHGYESIQSTYFVGNTLDATNNAPAFSAGPHVLPNAAPQVAYSASIAGTASDSEGDPLYYFMVSGPDWLTISFDGTLRGSPSVGEVGTFEVLV